MSTIGTSEPDDIWTDITPCYEHSRGAVDEGCSFCTSELNQRGSVIQQLQKDAETRARGLAQNGVQMPQEVFNAIRLDTMLDMLFSDPRARVIYEGEVGRRMVENLKQAQASVTSQMLNPQSKLAVVRNGMPNGMPKR